MRIGIGNDHRGYPLKRILADWLLAEGHEVHDCGAHSTEVSDHPLFAQAVGEAVAAGKVDLGVLACGSGVGISIAANKVPGAYAALIWNTDLATLARSHAAANIICFAADFTAAPYALDCLKAFLAATPDPKERYERRREQVRSYEQASQTASAGAKTP